MSDNEKSKPLIKTTYIFRKLKASLDNQQFEPHPDDNYPEKEKKRNSKRGTMLNPYDFDLSDFEPTLSTVLNPTPISTYDYIDHNPPESKKLRSNAYKMVKEVLVCLKEELGISEPEQEAEWLDENAAIDEYSLARVTPNSLFYVEEVVLELELYLKSMDQNISSADMKGALIDFQTRLGLPEYPDFYSLMRKSHYDFLGYLTMHEGGKVVEGGEDLVRNEADTNTEGIPSEDQVQNEADINKEGITSEACVGNEADTDIEDIQSENCVQNEADINVGKSSKDAEAGGGTMCAPGPYDHLPPPLLSLEDAKPIVYDFVYRLRKGKHAVCNADFLKLQSDLQLPEWLGLYETYHTEGRQMAPVVNFLIKYFGTSKVTSKKS